LISPKVDQLRVGDKVELKHVEHLPATIHGQVGDPAGRIAVQTYAVKETRSTVTVLWQDGTLETLMSTELIPYLNPDESDCW
jgi:ubiquitin-conjugating enzyme E2 O